MSGDFGDSGGLGLMVFLGDLFNKHSTKCLSLSVVLASSYMAYRWIGTDRVRRYLPWPFPNEENSDEAEERSDTPENPLLDYDLDGNYVSKAGRYLI